MAKATKKNVTSVYIPGGFEYRMSRESMKSILDTRKNAVDKGKNEQDYLCKYIDEQYGLKGTCVKVVVA
jgi:hypothetical protein